MKKEVLYISLGIPFDDVPHAGGKTLNYYIKKLSIETWANISIVAFGNSKDIKNSDGNKYGINEYYIERKNDLKQLVGNFLSINSKINPFHKYCNIFTWYAHHLLKNKLQEIKNKINPDVVIAEWTQIGLDIELIKQMFPKAKCIIDEVDVSFLGALRVYENERNKFKKSYYKLRYKNLKHKECKALHMFDQIIVQNNKDKKLLIDNGFAEDQILTIVPYFDSFANLEYNRSTNDIIFYGAMNRQENYLSAIWFINNVMPLLNDIDVRFVILGGNPHKSLMQYQNERIKITGYVDSVGEYFQNSLCMVAPLILGAGIKVKVIEALSAGIPVLTNHIGIEGISAKDKYEYFFCNNEKDYSFRIHELYNIPKNGSVMSKQAKRFIEKKFNLEESYHQYENMLRKIVE